MKLSKLVTESLEAGEHKLSISYKEDEKYLAGTLNLSYKLMAKNEPSEDESSSTSITEKTSETSSTLDESTKKSDGSSKLEKVTKNEKKSSKQDKHLAKTGEQENFLNISLIILASLLLVTQRTKLKDND